MSEAFAKKVDELGQKFNLDLAPDVLGACSILIDEKLTVQLELDESETKILIGSFLCEMPPGKFRENVFSAALKANNMLPRIGMFAYDEKSNSILLFDYVDVEIEIEKLFALFAQFIDKAVAWKEAIESGSYAPLDFQKELQK